MTADLPSIVAELRALFIVALMKQGATREDAERKATRRRLCLYDNEKKRWLLDSDTGIEGIIAHEDDARAILEAHYERLWCGIGDHKYAATVTMYRNGYSVTGNHAGSHSADDKLAAIYAAMRALYGKASDEA